LAELSKRLLGSGVKVAAATEAAEDGGAPDMDRARAAAEAFVKELLAAMEEDGGAGVEEATKDALGRCHDEKTGFLTPCEGGAALGTPDHVHGILRDHLKGADPRTADPGAVLQSLR